MLNIKLSELSTKELLELEKKIMSNCKEKNQRVNKLAAFYDPRAHRWAEANDILDVVDKYAKEGDRHDRY